MQVVHPQTSPYDPGSCRHSMIGGGAVRTVQQGLPTATPNTAFRSVSCSRPADGDHRMSARPIIGDAGVYLSWRHNWQVRAAGLAPESRFALARGVIFLPR